VIYSNLLKLEVFLKHLSKHLKSKPLACIKAVVEHACIEKDQYVVPI
jgi:hypothetical protein